MGGCRSSFAFRYNGTLCACRPGRYVPAGAAECVPLEEGEWLAGSSSVIGPTPGALLGEVLPLDSVGRVVGSEAVAVSATAALVLFWLAFCFGVRFGRVDGGRTVWFKVRWWISRLDLRFSTKHQPEDLKVVRKRKTELGGTFSVASWILFVGLLSAEYSYEQTVI